MFGRLNGVIFAALLFVTSLLGSIFILGPFIPLAFFAPRAWRFCADRFVGYWLTFPASMLFFLFGVRFRVSGDLIRRDKPALIIMNHRTRLDWLFFWNALYKMDPWLLTTEKISLKSGLKNIPGAGWAMGCGSYVFLNRNYEYDQRVLETMIKYYKDSHGTYQLLLFPEGTDRGERAVTVSHSFADRNGLPRYDYLLHPRITGFNYILNQMRKNDYIEDVYDVTVGYPKTIIDSELRLVKTGKFPEEVHFDVKRYKLEEVLGDRVENTEEVDASVWLRDLWKSKEERLKQFYASEPDERRFEPSGKRYVWPVETTGAGYYVAFAFWILITSLWIYLAICSIYVKIYVVVVVAFYLWAQHHSGGVCFLLLEWFYGHRFFFEKGR